MATATSKRRVCASELAVMSAIRAHPDKRASAAELSAVTGIDSRHVREAALRLVRVDWLYMEDEDGSALVLGRPLRKLYSLTEDGEAGLDARSGKAVASFEERAAATRSSPRRGRQDILNTAFGVVLLRQLLAAGEAGETLNKMAVSGGMSTATAYAYSEKLAKLGWIQDRYARRVRSDGRATNPLRMVSLTELGRAEAERRVAATDSALGKAPLSRETLDTRHPVPEGHEAGIWMLVRMTERIPSDMTPEEQAENLRDCIWNSLGCQDEESLTIAVEPLS